MYFPTYSSTTHALASSSSSYTAPIVVGVVVVFVSVMATALWNYLKTRRVVSLKVVEDAKKAVETHTAEEKALIEKRLIGLEAGQRTLQDSQQKVMDWLVGTTDFRGNPKGDGFMDIYKQDRVLIQTIAQTIAEQQDS